MFKSRNRFLSLLLGVAFLLSTLNLGFFAVYAKTPSELREEREKIQNEINEAENRLSSISAEKAETEEYLNALMSKINLLQDKIDSLESEKSTLQAEIDAIQSKITATENEIKETQRQIDLKQAEFDKNYELYCQRLRAMYVSGSASTLEVLLTCPDMSAMLTRSQMIKSVSEQDSDQLNKLMKIMEEIESQKQALEIKRVELNEDKANLEKDKQSLQERINEINSSKSEYDAKADQANAIMRKLSNQKVEMMELIETNKEELAEVQRQINNAYSSASTGSGSGKLGYPTDSTVISAGFPRYSSGGWHGGIDFPVSTGSNVYAAGSGTVIYVAYLNYSYGFHIIIDHDDGLSTLYAHNSQILVSQGQKVSRGQVIAKSGSTGNSTGPHCHFEVRVNGNQVNPFNYL